MFVHGHPPHLGSADKIWRICIDFFFYAIDLHKHNTKAKSLLNKHTTEPYLIYGDQIGETKKAKKDPYMCIHK